MQSERDRLTVEVCEAVSAISPAGSHLATTAARLREMVGKEAPASDYMKEAERLIAAHESAIRQHDRGAEWDEGPAKTLAALLSHIQRGVPDPAEVPMPWPDMSVWGTEEVRTYSDECIQQYGAACRAAGEAAGYARGVADERERCASVAWAHYMDTCRRKGIGPDVLPDWCCAAALRGEVKP